MLQSVLTLSNVVKKNELILLKVNYTDKIKENGFKYVKAFYLLSGLLKLIEIENVKWGRLSNELFNKTKVSEYTNIISVKVSIDLKVIKIISNFRIERNKEANIETT